MTVTAEDRPRELEEAVAIRDLTIRSQRRQIEAQETELRRMARMLRHLRGERGQ